ncbi:MAG: DUF4404 family protein [Ignavibacteria bacterium]|nr:DUF4404 family protein [Ignavibacteria bacterium]
MKNTIKDISEKLAAESGIDPAKKAELLGMLEELNEELHSADLAESSEKISKHIMLSAEEITKEEKDNDIIDKTLGDLRDSVTEFEVSHPKLFEKVNNISAMLASMGI